MSKSCETHLVPNCPLCAKKPTNLVISSPAISPNPLAAPNQGTNVPVSGTPPPVSTISDPHASKIVSAANKYAAACDAFNTAAIEVKKLMSQLSEAKTREAEALTLRDAAQADLTKIMGEKS